MFADIVKANRSYRRFYPDKAVDHKTVESLVDLARFTPSGANLQPLRYIISADSEKNAKVFLTLAWAGYLTDWPGPDVGERPTAYVVILQDTDVSKTPGIDHGIAAQTIMLGAVEKGLGGCMFGSINRQLLKKLLNIPERYDVLLVLALGYPKEKVILEDVGPDGSIKYYRDSEQAHHVPKRRLSDVLLDL